MTKDIKDCNKPIYAKVSDDCLKKLKILAIQKDLSLSKMVSDLLEKSMSKKKLLPHEVPQTNDQ